MCEAKDEVECHVICIVKSMENAEVSYVADVRDEAGDGPRFEGPMRFWMWW